MCAYACASGCCPGQLPALPVLQQGWHVISHCPYQKMQLLALLCSKAILFGLSLIKITLWWSFSISNSHASKIVFITWSELSVETVCEREPSWVGVQQTQTAFTGGCLISTIGLLRKCRKGKQRLPTSNFYLRIKEEEHSQVWLDSSLPIVEIWMELLPEEVVKS